MNEEAQSSNELIGRDAELFDVSQTLARRKKNNVMLLGEAGVGKTAIVEGLAKLITEDNVPNTLKGMIVWQLNMSALIAGTRYRGDFEERVQDLIKILKDRQDIILFIDEIHTIMGAGSAGGGSPDLADALALTFALPVGKKHPEDIYVKRRKEATQKSDYDPYKVL